MEQPEIKLSARQRMAARLMKRGFTYRQMAAEMKISVSTVRHHLAAMRAKTHAPSFPAAILILNGSLRRRELKDMADWVRNNPKPSKIALRRLAKLIKEAEAAIVTP